MEAVFLNPKALESHSCDYFYHRCLATQPWECDTNNAERQQHFQISPRVSWQLQRLQVGIWAEEKLLSLKLIFAGD